MGAGGFPLTLHDSAARLGAFCWSERRLFEVLGGSVAALDEPAAKLLVDRHAAHAAWRAGQWWERLPVLAQVDREALVSPATPGFAALHSALAREESPVGFLAGVYRVALARQAGAYAAFRALTGPVADGPARRTLTQVETDLEADRAEGEHFVQTLLVSEAAIDEAAGALARLERLLLP